MVPRELVLLLCCRGRWLLGLLVLQSTSSFVLDSYQDLLKVIGTDVLKGREGTERGLLGLCRRLSPTSCILLLLTDLLKVSGTASAHSVEPILRLCCIWVVPQSLRSGA